LGALGQCKGVGSYNIAFLVGLGTSYSLVPTLAVGRIV